MVMAASLFLVGAGVQAGAVNLGMLVAGRVVLGLGVGEWRAGLLERHEPSRLLCSGRRVRVPSMGSVAYSPEGCWREASSAVYPSQHPSPRAR